MRARRDQGIGSSVAASNVAAWLHWHHMAGEYAFAEGDVPCTLYLSPVPGTSTGRLVPADGGAAIYVIGGPAADHGPVQGREGLRQLQVHTNSEVPPAFGSALHPYMTSLNM